MNFSNEGAAHATALAPVPAPAGRQVQRWLAIIQQTKDTLTIVLMLATGMLIFGIFCGIAIPGLVLYCLRWQLVPAEAHPARRSRSRSRWLWLWLLTLAHELVCAMMFYDGHPGHDELPPFHFEVGYALGAAVSAAALLNLTWAAVGKREATHER